MKRPTTAAVEHCLAALADLCAADNCGYQRDTMRYAGLFDAGRAALLEAGIDRMPAQSDWRPGPHIAEVIRAASVLLEKIEDMTSSQFACGEEQRERKALRAALDALDEARP